MLSRVFSANLSTPRGPCAVFPAVQRAATGRAAQGDPCTGGRRVWRRAGVFLVANCLCGGLWRGQGGDEFSRLVKKFVDALVWVILPVFLVSQGASLTEMGWIVGVYGFVWGGSQLFTGRLSDHVGRFWPNVLGMWICGAGVAMIPLGDGALWWSLWAGVAGYGIGALDAAFWFVALSMFASGALLYVWGEETNLRLNSGNTTKGA